MRCPLCGKRTHVIDSRIRTYGLRRRRECVSCFARFTTVETPLISVKRRVPAGAATRATMEQ